MKNKIIVGLLILIIFIGGLFILYTSFFQNNTPTVQSVTTEQVTQKSDVQLLQSYLGKENLLDSSIQYNYTLSGSSKNPSGQVITVSKPGTNGDIVGGTFCVSKDSIYLNEDVYTVKYVKIATIDGNTVTPIGNFPKDINQSNGYFL